MKRIAIITPMILPVPAVKGGAVEELITKMIRGNEKDPTFLLDVYTVDAEGIQDMAFTHTHIIPFAKDQTVANADRILDKAVRTLKLKKSFRVLDGKVINRVVKENYDAIVVENMTSLYRGLRPKVTCPVYFHIHNMIDAYRSVEDFRLMEKNGDRVWTVSKYLKEQLQQAVPNIKCELLYNSVDRKRFAPLSGEQKDALRKERNIEKEKIVFLYSGRILPEKGVYELLKAFGILKKQVPEAMLMVVGKALFEKENKTPYEQKITELAGNLSDVCFTGFVEPRDMPKVYGCADVVVMPSLCEETFGMVAAEAMSMGIPLIATRKGGLPEVVDSTWGTLIEVDGHLAETLAEEMKKLAEAPELREEKGRCALERMERENAFDDAYYFKRFCELLRKE